MTIPEQIIQQALTLRPEERVRVIAILEESLATQAFATPEIALAWANEVEERADAVERGEMPVQEWRAALSKLGFKH